MKRRHWSLRLLLALGVLTGTLGHAGTVYGPSGLILMPTAEVSEDRTPAFGISTFSIESGGRSGDWYSVTGAMGVCRDTEAGLTYLHRSGAGKGDGVGVFAKHKFLHETEKLPAVALGVDLIGGRTTKTTQAYLAATKSLTAPDSRNPFTLTVGMAYSRDREGARVSGLNPYAGFSLGLTDQLELVMEWQDRTLQRRKDLMGAVLAYHGKGYTVATGVVNNGLSRDPRFFFGVGFNVSTLD